jgi:high-affinity K+ transport system ATPase subunit B
VLPDGRLVSVASGSLKIGDAFEAGPGEAIPVDGDVIVGAAQKASSANAPIPASTATTIAARPGDRKTRNACRSRSSVPATRF